MQAPVTLCIVIEKAINSWLALDPDNCLRLASIDTRVIALHVTQPDITLYFIAESPLLRVQSFADDKPDAVISGSLLALSRLSAQQQHTAALFSADVTISGDTTVAGVFSACLSGSGIEWEEHFSHILGDVAAHQAGRLARQGAAWLKDSLSTIQQDAAEYLKDEINALPQPQQVREWLEDVDTLRDDVERLAARIQQLIRTRAAT